MVIGDDKWVMDKRISYITLIGVQLTMHLMHLSYM